jgi:hypothetical protein
MELLLPRSEEIDNKIENGWHRRASLLKIGQIIDYPWKRMTLPSIANS